MTGAEMHTALNVVRQLAQNRRRVPTARCTVERNVLLAASQILVVEIDRLEDAPARRLGAAKAPRRPLTVIQGGKRSDGELDDGPLGAA